eukprot:498500_1
MPPHLGRVVGKESDSSKQDEGSSSKQEVVIRISHPKVLTSRFDDDGNSTAPAVPTTKTRRNPTPKRTKSRPTQQSEQTASDPGSARKASKLDGADLVQSADSEPPAELAPQDDIPQLSGSVSEESPRRATDKTSVSEAGLDQSTSSDVYDDRTRVDLSMFDNVSPTGSDAVEDTPTNVPKENQAESTSKIPETVPTSSVSHITIGQDLGNIENQEAVKSEQMVQATHESAVKVIRGPAHEPTHELAPQVAHQQSGNMAASRSDTLLTTERSHGSLSQTPSDVLIKAPAINVQRKRPQSARPASRQDVVTGATLTDSESNH